MFIRGMHGIGFNRGLLAMLLRTLNNTTRSRGGGGQIQDVNLNPWGGGGGGLVDFYDGVIMSDPFLRPPNMLTKFFKDPKYVD